MSTPAGPGPAWVPVPAGDLDAVRAARVSRPLLLVHEPGGRLAAAALRADARWGLGRQESLPLALPWDERVSRLHAVVERHGDIVVIEDNDLSRNGTYVNGTRITGRVQLRHGDIVRCGGTDLTVVLPRAEQVGATVVAGDALLDLRAGDFTPMEQRVLAAFAVAGSAAPTNADVGVTLGVGSETVKTHLARIYGKLRDAGHTDRAQRGALAEVAQQLGLHG